MDYDYYLKHRDDPNGPYLDPYKTKCVSPRGHYWRQYSESSCQCTRCGQCIDTVLEKKRKKTHGI